MPKKASKTHQFDVQIVDKLKKLAWEIKEEEADHVNLLRLPVQIVVKRTLCLFNHGATSQSCVEIVSNLNDRDNCPKNRREPTYQIYAAAKGYHDTLHSLVFLWFSHKQVDLVWTEDPSV